MSGISASSRMPAAASAIGTTPKKIQVHAWVSSNQPCKAGASVAGATTDPIANSACKSGWRERGKARNSRACPAISSTPPETPCRQRSAISRSSRAVAAANRQATPIISAAPAITSRARSHAISQGASRKPTSFIDT